LKYVTLLAVHWTCDEPAHIPEKDRRRALEKDAWTSAQLLSDPEMIRTDETDLGFFCLFKTRGISEGSRARLEALAARAGIAIGACKDTDSVYVWLRYVFDSLIKDSQEPPGVVYPWERLLIWQKGTRTGFLPRVCEVSAVLCSRLERQALEAEQSKQNIGGQAEFGVLNIRLQAGKRCSQIIEQMKRFKYLRRDRGMTVEDIQKENPNFLIWKVREGLSAEERDLFDHPNRWESVVTYAYGLLGKEYGKSWATIRDWVKAWKRSQRSRPTP
jgi:hypothetical protein